MNDDLAEILREVKGHRDEARRAAASAEDTMRAIIQAQVQQFAFLNTMGEMLKLLLEAAGEGEQDPDSELAKLLRAVVENLTALTAQTEQVVAAINLLPAHVEAATVTGVQLAMGGGVDLPKG